MSTRPPVNDHLKIGKPVKVSIATIFTVNSETIACSCQGWAKRHARKKIREDAAQKHLDKHHGGQGIWMTD